MRTISLLTIAILFTVSCRKSSTSSDNTVLPEALNSWVKVQVPPSSVDDICFINQSRGIIAGQFPYGMWSTSDGGQTWDSIPGTRTMYASSLQFVDGLNGFALGNYLWTTSDGGLTWVMKPVTINAISFQFINTTAGFILSNSKGIYVTHNGGSTWTQKLAPEVFGTSERFPFYFLDSLRGFSVMSGKCYATSDGGQTWKIKGNVTAKPFYGNHKMQFLDTLTGYCGTSEGLLKTKDGGNNWVNCFKATNSEFDFQKPHFFDSNNGYFMTNREIYQTTDGGQTWAMSCRLGNDYVFSSIFFFNLNTGWASAISSAGNPGYILMLKQ